MARHREDVFDLFCDGADVGDHADHAPARRHGAQRLDRGVEIVAVQGAESLVQEQRFQPAAAARHHLDHAEREREGGDELLAAGEAGGRPRLSGIAVQDTPLRIGVLRVDERVPATAHRVEDPGGVHQEIPGAAQGQPLRERTRLEGVLEVRQRECLVDSLLAEGTEVLDVIDDPGKPPGVVLLLAFVESGLVGGRPSGLDDRVQIVGVNVAGEARRDRREFRAGRIRANCRGVRLRVRVAGDVCRRRPKRLDSGPQRPRASRTDRRRDIFVQVEIPDRFHEHRTMCVQVTDDVVDGGVHLGGVPARERISFLTGRSDLLLQPFPLGRSSRENLLAIPGSRHSFADRGPVHLLQASGIRRQIQARSEGCRHRPDGLVRLGQRLRGGVPFHAGQCVSAGGGFSVGRGHSRPSVRFRLQCPVLVIVSCERVGGLRYRGIERAEQEVVVGQGVGKRGVGCLAEGPEAGRQRVGRRAGTISGLVELSVETLQIRRECGYALAGRDGGTLGGFPGVARFLFPPGERFDVRGVLTLVPLERVGGVQ